jgi:hypothetical protein
MMQWPPGEDVEELGMKIVTRPMAELEPTFDELAVCS